MPGYNENSEILGDVRAESAWQLTQATKLYAYTTEISKIRCRRCIASHYGAWNRKKKDSHKKERGQANNYRGLLLSVIRKTGQKAWNSVA